MSTTPPLLFLPPISFGLAAGPLLVQASVGLFLLGVLLSQAFYYHANYKQDPVWIKTLVYSVCCFEVLSSAFSIHTMWTYFVLEVENILVVTSIVWSGGAILIAEMLVVALVQGFYIYRIWQLSHSITVTLLSLFALFCRCALGLATAVLTHVFPSVLAFTGNRAVLITVNFGLAVAVVVDMMTTGFLIYYLFKQGSHVRQTRHIIYTLTFYAVNTGALAIIFSIATLLTFNLVRMSFMFAGFVIISTKVYANSLLAMLNARNRIKQSDVVHSIPLTISTSIIRHKSTCPVSPINFALTSAVHEAGEGGGDGSCDYSKTSASSTVV